MFGEHIQRRSAAAVAATTAIAVAFALLFARELRAQVLEADKTAGARPSAALVDVPYVFQEEALCGAAAVAMVMRYWGVNAGTGEFAHLVDRQSEGIPTGRLVQELQARGWRALPFRGTRNAVRAHLAAARPAVVLIADKPGRYHYLVVVAWHKQTVIVHDPAVGPLRVLPEADFRSRWSSAGAWTLVILPPKAGRPMPATPLEIAQRREADVGDGAGKPALPEPPVGQVRALLPGALPSVAVRNRCSVLLDAGVRAARAGGSGAAEDHIRAAAQLCPEWGAPLRELAGLRFMQQRPDDVERLAELALALDPADRHAAELLAIARYLRDDIGAALDAWNYLAVPAIDIVEVAGLTRTRHPIVGGALGVRPDELLTRDGLELARRRLLEIPAVRIGDVRYTAPAGGRTRVQASVVERPLFHDGPIDLAVWTVRSVVRRQISATVSSPGGSGATWTGTWRWREGRPRVVLGVRSPALAGFGGTWSFEVSHAEESHAPDPANLIDVTGLDGISEIRSHAGVTISDWSGPRSRWEVTAGWDRWRGRGEYLGIGVALERWRLGSRFALRLAGNGWFGASNFAAGGVRVAWHSDTEGANRWMAGSAVESTFGPVPLDLRPGAGTGNARPLLLRAHPLLDGEGRIAGAAMGRHLIQGTFEQRRRLMRLGPVRVGTATFMDVAKAWNGSSARDSLRLHVDIGAGLRLAVPGEAGEIRIDLARGLRDGATVISIGWQRPWPFWRE